MSRYVEWATMAGRYPDIARVAGAEGAASYWISYAEHEVDARLACRYTVPFSPAPPIIQDLVMDLAYYRMNLKQKWAGDVWTTVNERLMALINGTMSIVTGSGTVLGTLSTGVAFNSTSGWGTAFGMDDPLEWRIDSSWMPGMEGTRD